MQGNEWKSLSLLISSVLSYRMQRRKGPFSFCELFDIDILILNGIFVFTVKMRSLKSLWTKTFAKLIHLND